MTQIVKRHHFILTHIEPFNARFQTMGAGASFSKPQKYTLSLDVEKELEKPKDASDLGSFTYRPEVTRLRNLFRELIFVETKRKYGESLHRAAADGNVEGLDVLYKNGVNNVNEIESLEAPCAGRTPLYYAAANNQVDAIQFLLERGADVNIPRSVDLATPLWAAAANGHLKAVETLLSARAGPNDSTNFGMTPAMAAAFNGHLAVLEALHAHPAADVRKVGEETNENIYHYAVLGGRPEILLALRSLLQISDRSVEGGGVEEDASVESPEDAPEDEGNAVDGQAATEGTDTSAAEDTGTILKSLLNRLIDDVEKLLLPSISLDEIGIGLKATIDALERGQSAGAVSDRGAGVAGALYQRGNADGLTPLALAVIKRNPEIVKTLVESFGADVNAADNDGITPLAWAIKNEDEAISTYLRTHGAYKHKNIFEAITAEDKAETQSFLASKRAGENAQDDNGWAPLHFACKFGSLSIVQTVLNFRPKINLQTFRGETPAFVASRFNNSAVLKLVYRYGGDITWPSFDKTSPLMCACNHGSLKAVKLLVKLKAPCDDPDKHGRTPLMLSSLRGFDEIVQVLVGAGADVNYKSSVNGNTPLIAATSGGNRLVVENLLGAGADTNVLNHFGMTALDYSKLSQRGDLQYVLRSTFERVEQEGKGDTEA
jgi:ankyrin repeat protein